MTTVQRMPGTHEGAARRGI